MYLYNKLPYLNYNTRGYAAFVNLPHNKVIAPYLGYERTKSRISKNTCNSILTPILMEDSNFED
jgi:hypothetical protein